MGHVVKVSDQLASLLRSTGPPNTQLLIFCRKFSFTRVFERVKAESDKYRVDPLLLLPFLHNPVLGE